jgi:hypothetical protein
VSITAAPAPGARSHLGATMTNHRARRFLLGYDCRDGVTNYSKF